MNDIKLNFINRSNDTNNSRIVIFQKNVAETFDELAIAWKVIENCGPMDNHPFTYPLQFDVSASDSWGNYTPQFKASDGQAYEMVKDNSGDVLQLSSTPATRVNEVEIRNNLPTGAINANVYRGGKLLAQKTSVVPGQKAVFQFKPSLYIGIVSQIQEGDVMNSAILQSINQELSLLGITSADIVMTGGGKAGSFMFSLENINV